MPSALIVGAGPAGATLADLLAHPGVRRKVASQATPFVFGVTDVKLEV